VVAAGYYYDAKQTSNKYSITTLMIGEKLQKIIVLLDGNSSLDEGKFLIGWREN